MEMTNRFRVIEHEGIIDTTRYIVLNEWATYNNDPSVCISYDLTGKIEFNDYIDRLIKELDSLRER